MLRYMQDVQGSISLPGDFAGKIFCQDRKTGNRCSPHTADDRPEQIGGHRQTQDERKLGRYEQHAYCRQHGLCVLTPRRRRRSARIPWRRAPAQSARAIMNKWWTISERARFSTSASHGPAHNPCSAQAVLMHIVERGANRQKRWLV